MPIIATKRASEVYLRFGFHEAMESAALLPVQGEWNAEKGRLRIVNTSAHASVNDCGGNPGGYVSPTSMAIGDALSVTASCMKFHDYTRAQIMPLVNVEDVEQVWHKTVAFVAQSIFTSRCASYAAVSARVVTIGGFVERVTSSQFSVGIITQTHDDGAVPGSATSQDISLWRSECLGSGAIRSETEILLNADVPICRQHRQHNAMSVRAEVGSLQVSAGALIPPIHVHCRFHGHHHVLSTAISSVKLFMIRPSDSKLQGITAHHVNGSADEQERNSGIGCFQPPLPRSVQPEVPAARHMSSRHPLREHFIFEHVAVSAPGETLIGVECIVRDAYRPFVAPLLQWIPPFLVLPSTEATH